MTLLDQSFVIYLAGVADSDGSFCYTKRYSKPRGKHYYNGMFQLTWKEDKNSIAFMEELVQRYGGAYQYTTGHTAKKPCKLIHYTSTGEAMVKLANDVIPFLRLKKEQAQIALDGAALKSRRWGVKGKPEAIWDKERNLYLRANKLNNKNKKIWHV